MNQLLESENKQMTNEKLTEYIFDNIREYKMHGMPDIAIIFALYIACHYNKETESSIINIPECCSQLRIQDSMIDALIDECADHIIQSAVLDENNDCWVITFDPIDGIR